MNIKPSLQTRTRFNDYIENISFGHLRHDFAQVNVRQAATTIWAIIQLSARFSFITGFGGPDDREAVTPLASFVSSLSEDADGMEPSTTATPYRMGTAWEHLLYETLAEVDLCVRGGQVGSEYHLHLLDQAMEELITASAAECPSNHQRFYDYFLRDMFGSYHARYVWLKAQRVEMITGRSTPAKGMPSDSLKIPQWITEDVLFELDESRVIDFRVLNGDMQKEHWNDLSLFAKIAILVRDSLSDPLVDKPFDKLVGTLDQFFTLFLAQRMVANEAEMRGITRKPIAGDPEGHLRDQLGTAPLAEPPTPVERSLKSLGERFGASVRPSMEGEGDRPIQAPDGYDWLISDVDQEMVRPSSPHPKVVHAAEQANLQSVMRNLIRGYTRNGKLGADALDPNLFISQTVKYFLGTPPPDAGSIFGESQHVEHKPTLLRGGEESSDPAAKQLLSVEEQRKANREAEVTELLYAALPGDPVAEGFQEKFNALREQVLTEAIEKGVTARRGLSDLVDRAVALYGTGFKKPRAITEQEIAALEPVLWPLGRTTWANEERVVYGLLEGKDWMIGGDLYSVDGIPLDLNGAVPGKRDEDGTLKCFGGTLDSLMGEWLHEQVVFALPGDANHLVPPAITLYQLPEADTGVIDTRPQPAEEAAALEMPADGSGMTVWIRNFIRGCYVTRDLTAQQQDDLFHHLDLHKGINTILSVDEQAFVERSKKWMDRRSLPYPESADAYVEAAGEKMLSEAIVRIEEERVFKPANSTQYEYVPVLTCRGQDEISSEGKTYGIYKLRDDSEYILFEPIFDRVGRALNPERCRVVSKQDGGEWVFLNDSELTMRYPNQVNGLHSDDALALVVKVLPDLGDIEDYCMIYVKREVKKEQ